MDQQFPDHYQANISLLKKNHPDTWQLIKRGIEPSGELVAAQNGAINIRTGNQNGTPTYLHLQHDPTAEIPDFLKLVPEKATGVVAMFGMGLGYTPLAILKERKSISLFAIFEADAGIFIQALRTMDLTPLLTDPRVILCVGEQVDINQKFSYWYRTFILESIYTLRHVPSMQRYQEVFKKLHDEFFRFANKQNVEGATSLTFGQLFTHNRFSQLTAIQHDHFLDRLQGSLADIPAILVAGGPSLDKNIHLLENPELMKKAVIFAADTVLPALHDRNIYPHFVSSIDPQNVTYEKFADLPSKLQETSLICPPWVTPKVPKYIQAKNVFWLFSQGTMETWLNKILGGQILFTGAGTVAQLNLYSALLLGCSPIIFIGQDLAYSESRDHAAHTALPSADLAKAQLENKQEVYMVKGTLGGEVQTTRAFISMKTTFENIIRDNTGRHYINATEGGAHIEGTSVMSLSDALDLFCLHTKNSVCETIESQLNTAIRPNTSHMMAEFKSVQEEIKKLEGYISTADKLTEEVLKSMGPTTQKTKSFKRFEDIPGGIRKKIQKIEKLHGHMDRSSLWIILQELTLDGLRDSIRMQDELDRIKKDPNRYKEWLLGNLNRLIALNKARARALSLFLPEIERIISNHETEEKLQAAVMSEEADWKNKLELAQFYLENGDIKIARPILEEIEAINPENVEILIARGKIALLQKERNKADDLFSQALLLDSDQIENIDEFRKKIANEYLQYANRYLYIDKITHRNMLLKGFTISNEDKSITQIIKKTFTQDIKSIYKNNESFTDENATTILNFWGSSLLKHCDLQPILPKKDISTLLGTYGHLMEYRGEQAKALKSYEHAAQLTPDDAECHLNITKIYFDSGELEKGVAHLVQAVRINPEHARYWEEIGDKLFAANQFNDALDAYEQCFLALPHHLDILIKIGNCYLANGQEEAAHEAFSQYKQRKI